MQKEPYELWAANFWSSLAFFTASSAAFLFWFLMYRVLWSSWNSYSSTRTLRFCHKRNLICRSQYIDQIGSKNKKKGSSQKWKPLTLPRNRWSMPLRPSPVRVKAPAMMIRGGRLCQGIADKSNESQRADLNDETVRFWFEHNHHLANETIKLHVERVSMCSKEINRRVKCILCRMYFFWF